MAKLRRAYLPRWIAWFTLGCVAVMWLWLTGEAFLSEPGGELRVSEWLVITAILAAVVIVIFLMATRRLPAYLIEVPEEEEDEP